MGDEILPGSTAFNRERAQAALERKGVVVQLNTSVSEVKSSTAVLADGAVLPHAGLIWTAGSSPTIPAISPAYLCWNGGAWPLTMTCAWWAAPTRSPSGISQRGQAAHGPPAPRWRCNRAMPLPQPSRSCGWGREPQPFQFEDRGEMLSLGVGEATLTGMGLTLAGPLAFQLRRATYLTRLPGLSLGLRSAGAWLLNR